MEVAMAKHVGGQWFQRMGKARWAHVVHAVYTSRGGAYTLSCRQARTICTLEVAVAKHAGGPCSIPEISK